jgi:hypothetical protein
VPLGSSTLGALQWDDVIDHVAGAGTRWQSGLGARIRGLECSARGRGAPAAIGVPFAG